MNKIMEEEQLPEPKRRKIEDTIVDILRTADLETATEHSVRTDAADRLGFELSSLPHKRLIRDIVDSILLSSAASAAPPNKLSDNSNPVYGQRQQLANGSALDTPDDDNGRVICKLNSNRMVKVRSLGGKTLVSIWDYYWKDGKQLPGSKGVSLTVKQWSSFRSSFPAIQDAITKMESKIRHKHVGKQTEAVNADISRSFTVDAPELRGQIETCMLSSNDSFNHQENGSEEIRQGVNLDNTMKSKNPERLISTQRNQTRVSSSNGSFNHQENYSEENRRVNLDDTMSSLANFPSQSIVPIKTTRLDGKNYYCWKHLMEYFLKQIHIAYVLIEPCPNIPTNPEMSFEETLQAKAAVEKWIHDDYVCCHSILNSLSDKLFEEFSKKTYTSKELWEKLKSVYDEDFGTMRSQVNKYIQFQILDGVSILDQVEELNHIADSIIASGVLVDDNFHVSAIISKLPPSWKDLRLKLMHEKFLPLNTLMHQLKTEEDSRNRCRYKKPFGDAHVVSKQ